MEWGNEEEEEEEEEEGREESAWNEFVIKFKEQRQLGTNWLGKEIGEWWKSVKQVHFLYKSKLKQDHINIDTRGSWDGSPTFLRFGKK